MTMPHIDPKTGHEPGLPNPRPRNDIYAELLASHQTDPNIHLFDLFYRLQTIVQDMDVLVTRELERIKQETGHTKK